MTLYPLSAASARYRVHQFLPQLESAGISCTVSCAVDEAMWALGRGRAWRYHLHEALRRRKQLDHLDSFDRIFIHKGLTSSPVRGMLGRVLAQRHKLVYDLDDAVHLGAPDRLPRGFRWLEAPHLQGLTLMREARMTLAGNRWLAEQVAAEGGRARYLPTVVDTDRFRPMPQPDSEYRLGWMGSPSTAPHLATIADALRGEELLAVGTGDVALPLEARREAWALEREVEQIVRMSVGLMPLPHDTWSLGKCALKALLYMACGRPVIATPWGAAKEVVVHGETGLLADTMDEWRAAIAQLRDPAERARMGGAARARVEEHYSLRAWGPRLVEYLKEFA